MKDHVASHNIKINFKPLSPPLFINGNLNIMFYWNFFLLFVKLFKL